MLHHLLSDAEFWVLLAVVIFAAGVWKPVRRFVVGTLDHRAKAHEPVGLSP